ncbi:unnamed protein product [Caenorhabditis bovis]|uniref:DUF4460 domain-containing protein n=1 Tax=Caenorhabditis bovis TaxID=2654633 RepID=A0A8S1EIU8_9PELO|nr:unnamed protein product [Caenorhabditis bovis]
MSLQDVSTALRPFFFAVHPDRFAQYPSIRSKNEKALQIFNGYLNDLFPISPFLRPIKVQFSIADSNATNKFKEIQIQLSGTDPVKIVKAALESCQLSTKNLKPISEPVNEFTNNNDDPIATTNLRRRSNMPNLLESLLRQRDEAIRKSKEATFRHSSISDEIDELKKIAGLKDIVFEMSLNDVYIQKCLNDLQLFIDSSKGSRKKAISHAFTRNILRFGQESFTCSDGSIQLGMAETPEMWEQACIEHQVRRRQVDQLNITSEHLAAALGGAQILLPTNKDISEVLNQINSLMTRIWKRDDLTKQLCLAGKQTMIEVTSANGILSIGVDGRIFVPCAIDIQSLTNFLKENREKSVEINHKMQALMNELNESREECIHELKLRSLNWEANLGQRPEKLLDCIYRLRPFDPHFNKSANICE